MSTDNILPLKILMAAGMLMDVGLIRFVLIKPPLLAPLLK